MVKKERQVHLSALFFGPLPRVILQNCRILKLFYRWIRQNFTFAQKIKMVHIKTVSSHEELVGIKKLLEANLKQNLSPEERASQGFVTCDYSIEFLTTIQQKHPSIIAVDQGEVVGYALVVTRDSKHLHPLIDLCLKRLVSRHYFISKWCKKLIKMDKTSVFLQFFD